LKEKWGLLRLQQGVLKEWRKTNENQALSTFALIIHFSHARAFSAPFFFRLVLLPKKEGGKLFRFILFLSE
jgi:hypothetical protein